MRVLAAAVLLIACSAKSKTTVTAPPVAAVDTPPVVAPKPEARPDVASRPARAEVMAADTPKATVAGNTFIAPVGWSVAVRGQATIVAPPEDGSFIAFVDVQAKDSDQAVTLAWAAYNPDRRYPHKLTTRSPDKDGWSEVHGYDYIVSPNEKRVVGASASFANGMWTVVIFDVAQAVAEKRAGQIGVIFDRFFPKGYEDETFAGRNANKLDAARIAELTKFVDTSSKLLGVPGVSFGIVQDGKVVFTGGVGVRQLGKPAKVDGDTKFMVASNTKALTTLMLGKLVDEKKLTWDSTATSLLPTFKLGDADTTSKVLVKHLICACTGLPRQDFEWLFEYKDLTPEGAMKVLGTMQPTSKFGELFQYSNPLAAAAGYIGGHVAFPKLELGKAYDEAMKTRVFGPLGMTTTTFDFTKGKAGNSATAHSQDIDGKTAIAMDAINYAVIPVRPAGAAWSTVKDMLKYVQMELDEGKLRGGKQYIAKETLLARRAPQVAVGKDVTYGMGLSVDSKYKVTVVHHGGDMVGMHSDMMWLPEHNVGAVILTNGDPGWTIRSIFRRKLLEVLFDGKPEADKDVAAAAKNWFEQIAAERKLLVVPADAAEAGKLATNYSNDALGQIAVSRVRDATVFDFTEWKSEMATKKNPDGTTSFVTTVPGANGFEFVAGTAAGKRTLTARDGQHEYVFTEK